MTPTPPKPLTIRDLVREAHATATSKGWHAPSLRVQAAILADKATPHDERSALYAQAQADRFGALMALIATEVSEAVDAYREHRMEAWTLPSGKIEGVAAELADVMIRVADVAGVYGIDLEAAITAKMAYNKTRPTRHGGKAL